jgi:predicted O-linked N-acetylglucosamine transferase (SPINDLY family)
MNPMLASLMNQSIQHLNGGRLDNAEALLKQVLQMQAKNFDALHMLGIIKGIQGDHLEARRLFKKAVAINPAHQVAQFNLARALSESGNDAESIAHHVKATQLAPNDPEAWLNYGISLSKLQRDEPALESYRNALRINPAYAQAWANLGTSLKNLQRYDEALQSFAKALDANPGLAQAWSGLGSVLQQLKRYDEALAAYEKALGLSPDAAQAWFHKGVALIELKRYEEALEALDACLGLSPDHAEAWCIKGYALNQLWHPDLAQAACERATAIKPGFAAAWANLGRAIHQQGKPTQAVEYYRKALWLNAGLADVHNNLGYAEQDLGRPGEAIVHYRQALSVKPDYASAYSNLLFVHAYNVLGGRREYLELARGWERACVSGPLREAARHRAFRNPPRAGRRLKVGYVSGDFRRHAASYFVERLFTHHNRDVLELYAYSAHGQEDAVTARLRELVEHWVPVAGRTDDALRDRIEADGIDVLIDLTGHTAHDRLGVFARRAAPVQAHYLGYFASTGLTEMDYWIGDGIITPAAADADFCEQVWRLPRVWVSYEGKRDAPRPDWRPRADGTVWLGSFNNLRKLTPATLEAWAQVLRALPAGRLLLKTKELADVANRQRILQALQAAGVAPERIELQDGATTPDWNSHMACYNGLDLALDPIGAIGGGTTTCDALWMAVPVLTLEGDRMASRMTASMLHAVGHPEWIAHSADDYVQKVVDLARDADLRSALRAGLRGQMAASPLCDAAGLARQLEQAYINMYERWQAKQP